MQVNVYDFDNTIYDGESLADFFFFIIKKKKSAIRYIPLVLYTLSLYKLRLVSDEKANKIASKMAGFILKNKKDVKRFVDEFWLENKHKLKKSFLKRLNRKSVIITASPSFLMNGIKKELKTKHIIASEFNMKTVQFDFLCLGKNKITAFEKNFGKKKIKEFYSDSLNDLPMMRYAEKAFLVKKNRIEEINLKN